MPLTKVAERNGHVIFKVMTQKGAFLCYRVFRNDKLGDSSAAMEKPTLTEALLVAEVGA